MKLRIKGNSLRLRLSQTDVEQLKVEKQVSDKIKFGPTKAQSLLYRLMKDDVKEVMARYQDNEITISIPDSVMLKWFEPEEVTIRAAILMNADTLNILVEKDFQCLKPRPEESEEDLFPHPEKNSATC